MADMKIPPSLPAVRPLPAARAEAIKAAQRAFFQAATGSAAPPEPTARTSAPNAPSEPQRYARPGSLLDVKV